MAEMIRIAAASDDGENVNRHFGKAAVFYIYEVSDDENIEEVGVRELDPVCAFGMHDPDRLLEKTGYLKDCDYVIAEKIGPGAMNALEQNGIEGYELPGQIRESILRLLRYKQVQNLLDTL